MKIYVASKTRNPKFALDATNVIEICETGPNPEADAHSYARDWVCADGTPAYVYEVDIKPMARYSVNVEVQTFDSAE